MSSNYTDFLFENHEEVAEPVLCKPTGEVPKWLEGTMLRNGPGMFRVDQSKLEHLFDGFSYIQRFHFTDQNMWYSAKFLKSQAYLEALKQKKLVLEEFGTNPSRTIFGRLNIFGRMNDLIRNRITDNALVNIIQCGHTIYAVTETPYMHRINPENLETMCNVDFSKIVLVNSLTAHQLYDHERNIYNIGLRIGRKAEYVFMKTDRSLLADKDTGGIEKTIQIGTCPASNSLNPAYFHSFGMTDSHIILYETPMRLNVLKMFSKIFSNKTFQKAINWMHDQETIVRIFNYKTQSLHPIAIHAPSFFVFHHANSYEDDGFIILDYVRIDRLENFDAFLIENLTKHEKGFLNEFHSCLYRMVIPLNIPINVKIGQDLLLNTKFSNKCRFIKRSDGTFFAQDYKCFDPVIEFPRYNDEYRMKPYQYVYAPITAGETLDGIIKMDVANGTSSAWMKDNNNQCCTESVFVPRPNFNSEDDGILICPIVSTKSDENSFIAILCAKTMKELCRFNINHRLPFSFHCHFIFQV